MTNKRLLSILWVSIVLFFGSILAVDLVYESFNTPSNKNQHDTTLVPILKQSAVTTKFSSLTNELHTVYIPLQNENGRNTDPLLIDIAAIDTGQIRTVALSGRNIRDNEDLKVTFEPLRNIQGKMIAISVRSETPNASKAVMARVDASGDIAFRSYGQKPVDQTIRQFVTLALIRFFQDPGFAIFYIILVSMILIGFIISLNKR